MAHALALLGSKTRLCCINKIALSRSFSVSLSAFVERSLESDRFEELTIIGIVKILKKIVILKKVIITS